MSDLHKICVTVNDRRIDARVDSRIHLADFLRKDLLLTGTHLGCEHGVCGACTVLVDDMSVRSCLMLAVQADRRHVRTIEGVVALGQPLHPLQAALARHHGLQCGFCTPGIVMTLIELAAERRTMELSEAEIRTALSGNLCRCTGYQGIVEAASDFLGQENS